MPEVRINLTAKDNASDDIKRVKKSLEKLARTKDIKINVSAPKLAEIKRSIGNIRDKSVRVLSLIHISEPTRLLSISYAVFCLKKKI